MIKITYKLILLLSLLAMTVTSFAASEAEYGKVSKAWTLHADGSQEYRSSMELTLFTHTAMNSTYGESFIVYNPDFQTLKIHSSYTRQKDGTIVKTPDNAFVEVLPRFAADAPAYNQLKEMVVVHTGLELGATIYLDYSIITKPGYYPALDINERLQETSPVKECKVSIPGPENRPPAWQLLGSDAKASQATRNGAKEVSWTLRNLPASSREAFLPQNQDGIPRLIASSYSSNKEALSTLNKRFNTSGNYESKTFGSYITEKATSDEEKVNAIRNHVVNNMGYCAIPLACTGYSIRNVDTALRSAYGTLAEKTQLLNVLLNAVGIQSEVVAVYPGNLDISHNNLDDIKKQLKIQTIGHDKVNQLRHVRFFKDIHGMVEHMRKHANILRPKFEAVENILDRELGGLEIGTWTKPHGGYFISFDSLNGCAKEIVAKCKKAGVVMTGAGATYPYGKDPEDRNIRIAPSYPPLQDLITATELFALCVKLVSVNKLLEEM